MTSYLYLLLDIGSIAIPLGYSIFEKKFYFIQHFKKVSLSIFSAAVPFLIWDAIFTANGIWGFNSTYHIPFLIAGMPLEEWLFFFCIPYACLFTSEVLKFYFPDFKLSLKIVKVCSILLLLMALGVAIFNLDKWYTVVNFGFLFVLLSYTILFKKIRYLQYFYLHFLIILIPFFGVNGILTGSGIENPIVWYNHTENMGIRLGTIPVEDIFYAFNLLFLVQLLFNYFINKKSILIESPTNISNL